MEITNKILGPNTICNIFSMIKRITDTSIQSVHILPTPSREQNQTRNHHPHLGAPHHIMNRNMFRQAQAMQKKIQEMQEEIAQATTEASVGGGAQRNIVASPSNRSD